MKARAIVSYCPENGQARFRMEDVILRETQRNELLVEMVASGICSTDLFFATTPEGVLGPFPRVLGHEGVGWVRAVGEEVAVAAVGDAVSLTFASCATCKACVSAHSAYCHNFTAMNYGAAVAYQGADGKDLAGYFFGQSSFASLSNVLESSVVNISKLVESERDMYNYAALGCSFQSGSATVTRLASIGKEDSVVIMGLGGVGLSAVMAANIQECPCIIAVDRFDERLQLSKELGATHMINTSTEELNLVAEVRSITGGNGPTVTIDATGFVPLIKAGLEFTANTGKMIILGVPPLNADLNLNLVEFMGTGKSLVGSMEGDAMPGEHIPRMIEWFKSGVFPIDRLLKTYKAEEFEAAISDMKSGHTVKPVLLWK